MTTCAVPACWPVFRTGNFKIMKMLLSQREQERCKADNNEEEEEEDKEEEEEQVFRQLDTMSRLTMMIKCCCLELSLDSVASNFCSCGKSALIKKVFFI